MNITVWGILAAVSVSTVPGWVQLARDGTDQARQGATMADDRPIGQVPPICSSGGPYIAECAGDVTTIALDASNSRDLNHDRLTFSWTTAQPGAWFDDFQSPTPVLSVPSPGNCDEVVEVSVAVSDGANPAVVCPTTVTIRDRRPPLLQRPPDVQVYCGSPTDPDHTGWPAVSDDCNQNLAPTWTDEIVGDCPATIRRTWRVQDACGNAAGSDEQLITVAPVPVQLATSGRTLLGSGAQSADVWYPCSDPNFAVPDASQPSSARPSTSEKGSVVVYPKIEVRWDATGTLIRDTFLTLTSDHNNHSVGAKMYLVAEGFAGTAQTCIPLHPHRPYCWSVYHGTPSLVGVAPVQHEGDETFIRGYAIAWASDGSQEIRWNHLWGTATIVDYENMGAWEYNAYTFKAVNDVVADGQPTGTPGRLRFDGYEFASGFDLLLLDFVRPDAVAYSRLMPGKTVTHDTELTLLVLNSDFRQSNPYRTYVDFYIYNQDGYSFGAWSCLAQSATWTLKSLGGAFAGIQTDYGYARIDGKQSGHCSGSAPASLLGVSAKLLTFSGN